MAYIDSTFYNSYAPSTPIPENEFTELSERASDIIDIVSNNKIVMMGGISALSDSAQTLVKNAVAAEMQTLFTQGGIDAINGNDSAASASIGKFSFSQSAPIQTVCGMPLSPLVRHYLAMTGLLYGGVQCAN